MKSAHFLELELERERHLNKVKDKLVMSYVKESRALSKQLINKIQLLAAKNKELQEMTLKVIETLATTLEARDSYTRGHSTRVSIYAANTARYMGQDEEHCLQLEVDGLLHDLGKIGVPDAILNKPGKLSEEEYETMKKHPLLASQILSALDNMKEMCLWINAHHERFDGKGYPLGLKEKEIPREGSILALADSFDAITTDRPYRKARSKEDAAEELSRCSGSQFNPEITEVFLSNLNKITLLP